MNRRKRLKWTPSRLKPLKEKLESLTNNVKIAKTALEKTGFLLNKATDSDEQKIAQKQHSDAVMASNKANTLLTAWKASCPFPLTKIAA